MPLRFAALGWAARWLATSRGGDLHADIVHTHDWQAGLAVALREVRPGDASAASCVTTIHSIAYPGSFDPSVVPEARAAESRR